MLTALEAGPATLAGLVAGTGLARPTAHRLAVALEHHRLVARDMQGRFVLGPRLAELSAAAGEDRLLATAGPVLARLRDITGESAQLWRRQGDIRVCVAAAERPSGLRDTIPVGSQLTMRAGSAAQVLLAWEDPERMHRGLQNAAFSAAALSGIRRRGWAQSVGEREQGVASVSAPVRSPSGKIIAAVSVSGPFERLSRQPGRMHAPAVLAAAERLSESLRARCRRVRRAPHRRAPGLSPAPIADEDGQGTCTLVRIVDPVARPSRCIAIGIVGLRPQLRPASSRPTPGDADIGEGGVRSRGQVPRSRHRCGR